jgi:predicted enzyme related to lactoylglutathione lyase
MLRVLKLAAFGLLLGASISQAQDPELPPLTDPPTNKVLAGKFVWADLVTDDVESVKTFYTSLFNLGWQEIRPAPQAYGLFTVDGLPVAGLSYHESPNEQTPYGRWIHYMSVDDVARAQQEVEKRGGRTVLSRRSFDKRGEFAIVMGADQALVGLMRSSSGDPDDYRSVQGEWLWRELYTADPSASAELYKAICECEVYPNEDRDNSFLVASQNYLRASINLLVNTENASPSWLGYVQVADVPATVDKALALGGSVIFAPTPDVFNGRLAVISDPVGGYLGLVHWEYDDNGEAAR